MTKERFADYPELTDLRILTEQIRHVALYKFEQGSKNINQEHKKIRKSLENQLRALWKLETTGTSSREPDNLALIRKLRPNGPRKMWSAFDSKEYQRKLPGALIGRMAGCILGAPVELWSVEGMQSLAKENGDSFPPVRYWSSIHNPYGKRYQLSTNESYTAPKMNGVPVDDDIIYTLLGLLIVEEYGPDFTVDDVGKAWLKYLPYACTAEDIALKNLKKKVPALKAGSLNNPYTDWIGADIRSDPWAYVAPGHPEKAAQMAWTDAMISHRRNGLYGEMFFSAAISAAFALDDTREALEIGLTEIPKDCDMARVVKWALKKAPKIKNYKQARAEVDSYFKGMDAVHTLNNACLTIWGLTIGGDDFTKIIGETVAMGLDNDCTAATAGSLAGAVLGLKGIEQHWYAKFNNTIHSYLKGKPVFKIDDTIRRFTRCAEKTWSTGQ